MDCSVLAGALGVFTQSESEVEYQGDQIGSLVGFWVG